MNKHMEESSVPIFVWSLLTQREQQFLKKLGPDNSRAFLEGIMPGCTTPSWYGGNILPSVFQNLLYPEELRVFELKLKPEHGETPHEAMLKAMQYVKELVIVPSIEFHVDPENFEKTIVIANEIHTVVRMLKVRVEGERRSILVEPHRRWARVFLPPSQWARRSSISKKRKATEFVENLSRARRWETECDPHDSSFHSSEVSLHPDEYAFADATKPHPEACLWPKSTQTMMYHMRNVNRNTELERGGCPHCNADFTSWGITKSKAQTMRSLCKKNPKNAGRHDVRKTCVEKRESLRVV